MKHYYTLHAEIDKYIVHITLPTYYTYDCLEVRLLKDIIKCKPSHILGFRLMPKTWDAFILIRENNKWTDNRYLAKHFRFVYSYIKLGNYISISIYAIPKLHHLYYKFKRWLNKRKGKDESSGSSNSHPFPILVPPERYNNPDK